MTAAWMKRVHPAQGYPSTDIDEAPTALFLALFFIAALSNIFVFLRNKKRGRFFIFNALCIGFCMARVVTTSLRLGWMNHIENRSLALAATIFVAAGVLLLFVINLVFAQRILRGLHPHLGWHKLLTIFFTVLYGLIPLMLAMVITASVQSFFTTDPKIARYDLNMQRGASCYLLFVAVLPIPITLFALLRRRTEPADYFGAGSWFNKAVVVIVSSLFLVLGAGFRTGVSFVTPQPSWQTNPPWFQQKWAFYFFNFTVEYFVIIIYLSARIDKLFFVAPKSKGPGDYGRDITRRASPEGHETLTKRVSGDRSSRYSQHSDPSTQMEKAEV